MSTPLTEEEILALFEARRFGRKVMKTEVENSELELKDKLATTKDSLIREKITT